MKRETWRDIRDLLYSIFIDFTISFILYVILEYIINHKVIYFFCKNDKSIGKSLSKNL